jgi:heat shock protein HslJ
MNRMRMAGLAGLLTVLVAACSSNAGASATPTPTPEPTATPAASATASGGIPFPSIGNSDTALESLLPDAVDGITLQKYSMKGNEFMGSAQADPQTQAFLNALGVSPSDISVAFGFGVDIANQSALGVFAFKAPGAGADRLLTVFKTAAAQGDTTYDWQSATVSGKSVQQASEPSDPTTQIYLYPTNDVLFLVTGNAGPAADALSALP